MAQPLTDTKDTTPICIVPPDCTVSAPPESPLQTERPPAPLRHTCWLTTVEPQRAIQSVLVITGLLVNLTTAEVAELASDVRPNPDTVPVNPPNWRVSERPGRRMGWIRVVNVIGEFRRTVAMSLRRLVEL
uniref:Uncharacterized protein n=1 Tax=Anopheles merus TaxID=30066 RepID=A0A182UW72_ANOME